MKKVILKIVGMHCVSCAMNIDMELEDIEGIKQSNTSYVKSQTEVEFDPEKTSYEKIIDAIKKVGYVVTDTLKQ